MTDNRYSIQDLARLGGVSRRTVRYYVQEGLIPPPLGGGRGSHYAGEHLEALVRVREMQEEGLSLQEIRVRLSGGAAAPAPGPEVLRREAWTRIELAPGVELHVSSWVRLPAPRRLRQLQELFGRWFRREDEKEQGG